MATKRGHVSTGDTPGKPYTKQPSEVHEFSSRRSLFCERKSKKSSPWTQEETSALVQYISLYWEDAHTDKWPAMKQMEFWDKCAEAVSKTCKNSRTGMFTNHKFNGNVIKCFLILLFIFILLQL